MVLTSAAGWALERFAGWGGMLMVGLLVGMVLARFVPTKRACPLPGQQKTGETETR